MGEGTHLYGDRAPHNLQYVVLVASANLTQERVLTGTSNQITVTDNGAGSTVVLSTPQDIHTGASPTFAGITLTAAANISLTNTVAAGESLIDCHIIQSDDNALTGTLRGAYITASNGDEVATGTIRGAEIKARAGYPGETGANVNVLEGFSVSSDAKTYDVTTHRGGEIILDGGAGTSTLAVGLRIANNFQANRATTSYALEIYRDSFDYTADIYLSSGGLIGGTGGHLLINSSGYATFNTVGARIYNSGVQVLADSTVSWITFDSESYDDDDLHESVTNPSRLTCKTAGRYLISGGCCFDTNANGVRAMGMYVNRTTELMNYQLDANTGGHTRFAGATQYDLEVDDYIEMYMWQNSGGNLNSLAAGVVFPYISIQKIG